jgi:hypothetical protein
VVICGAVTLLSGIVLVTWMKSVGSSMTDERDPS